MKRFVIGLTEREGTYTIEMGTGAYMPLDARKSISTDLASIRNVIARRGYDGFAIVSVPNLRVQNVFNYLLYRETAKNLPLVD